MKNRLKELRIENNLTQTDIAKMLKIDQSNYSKYELEKLKIPAENLKKFAALYNTSIDYILYLTDEITPHTQSFIEK